MRNIFSYKRTMTTEYKKVDPISHIHMRPDMYIGSLKPRTQLRCWTADETSGLTRIIEVPSLVYSDGLLRIFIEALSNAIDNTWRSRKANVKATKIRVHVNKETGETSIWNDGLHIPIEVHATEKIYNPELIFGHLLSGSNLNDNEERLSSGRNGLGIKLLNVFSQKCVVEIFDPVNRLVYIQEWRNNMRICDKPRIKKAPASKKDGYTSISWVPDFEKFSMTGYDTTTLMLYKKFALDASMLTRLPVWFNDEKYYYKSFVDYVRIYFPETTKPELCSMEEESDVDTMYRTSVVIAQSPTQEYKEVSFVNGIETRDGGVHCDVVSNELFKQIVPKFAKGKITTKDVKPWFMIFVNAWLPNPEFSSQSKTKLLAPPFSFKMETRHVSSIMKWSFVEKIHELIKDKELLSLKKSEKKTRAFKRIEGLDPANLAGTKHASECTLILCEGLSAKTYATIGINVGYDGKKGRNYFGIYPLRGKCLNVRNASTKSIAENKEITDIIQALNLKYGTDYRDPDIFATLRYGRVMIITDADEDGYHISALIVNIFHKLFPTLLQREKPFLFLMMTPIAKIFRQPVQTFYNDFEYQRALDTIAHNGHSRKVEVKYFKGLGTSSDDEVRETFGQKVVGFLKDQTTDILMDRVFHKTATHERKEWLTTYDPKMYQTPSDTYTISLFINQELIRFSIEDCRRSLPCLYDGLKISQRKILFAVFKKNLVHNGKSMKVLQLAGYCAEHSNYHHGEQCLYDTITKMAQDYPGSNNVPYLARDGQFGSRAYSGKDAANARYIFTKMAPLTRIMFPNNDDHLLSYTLDDGDKVQPDFYVPIVPTILGNGCLAGIGTGWSCSVPSFDFGQLAHKVKEWLADPVNFEMDLEPSYRGFRGTIEKLGPNKYQSIGVLRPYTKGKKKNLWEITELPVHTATNKYKEDLECMVESKKLKSMQNFSTPNTVHFVIEPAEGFVPTVESMKLQSPIFMTNMVLFTEDNRLRRFDTIKDIFVVYAERRLVLYGLRKKHLVKQLKNELLILKNKRRFLDEVQNQKIKVFRVPERNVVEQLQTRSFDRDPRESEKRVSVESNHLHHGDENEVEHCEGGYSYLLRIPMRDFTQEKVSELDNKIKQKTADLLELEKTTEAQMWTKEIDTFLVEYRKMKTD